MARYVFPAILEPEDGLYNVSFPDLPDCYTCGDDLADAMHMAEDALCGYLSRAEERNIEIPEPSAVNGIAAADSCIVTLVLADTDVYRRQHVTKSVKKTLTIPSWLNEAAEARSINFSKVLQEALCERIGINA